MKETCSVCYRKRNEGGGRWGEGREVDSQISNYVTIFHFLANLCKCMTFTNPKYEKHFGIGYSSSFLFENICNQFNNVCSTTKT